MITMPACTLAVLLFFTPQEQGQAELRHALQQRLEAAERLLAENDVAGARAEVDAGSEIARTFASLGEDTEIWTLFIRLGKAAADAGRYEAEHELAARVDAHLAGLFAPDHPNRVFSRMRLAAANRHLRRFAEARSLAEENLRMVAGRADDDPLVVDVRATLANILSETNDHAAAVPHNRMVLAARLAKNDERLIQAAQVNLADSLQGIGELEEALELQLLVLRARDSLRPDDPRLLNALINTATTLQEVGDLPRARELLERACAGAERYPTDHPLRLRCGLRCSLVRRSLGDLRGALRLQEQTLTNALDGLPPHHPLVLDTRTALAITKDALGDVADAEKHFRDVYRQRLEHSPANDPRRWTSQENLAITMARAGRIQEAAELLRDVLDLRSSSTDALGRLRVQINLSRMLRDLGELDEAARLSQEALAALQSLLPDVHPLLRIARLNRAGVLRSCGDLAGAAEQVETALKAADASLPADHTYRFPLLQTLFWIVVAQGNGERAGSLVRDWARGVRRQLTGWSLSPREIAAMARLQYHVVNALGSLVAGCGTVQATPDLAGELLYTVAVIRGAEIRASRGLRGAMGTEAGAEADSTRTAVARAAAKVARIANEMPRTGDAQWTGKDHGSRLQLAVAERDRLLARLNELTQRLRSPLPADSDALAGRLQAGHAAVTWIGYTQHTYDAARPTSAGVLHLLAITLLPDGCTGAICLGPMGEVDRLVAEIRSSALDTDARGLGPSSTQQSAQVRFRKLVLDPVLATLRGSRVLHVSVADSLQLVPLDALSLDDGRLLGDVVEFRHLASLMDLSEPGAPPSANAHLLVFGGVQYDKSEQTRATDEPTPNSVAPARSGRPQDFLPLADTESEAKAIAALFEQEHDVAAKLRTDRRAGKSEFLAHAEQARYIHLATHGYFDDRRSRAREDLVLDDEPGFELSPYALCGLAMAGANLPAADDGSLPGILTGEEIAHLDLSGCDLVTLSACDTSIGVQQAGQGYASLRAALLGAGARNVVTSLWRIGDVATRDLMVDFYRRHWVQKKPPQQALWEARKAARERGALFRDWAGWVLTKR